MQYNKSFDDVTRCQFAAFLVRALGIKTADYKVEFKDVPASKWYAKEVEVAKDAGLVDGISAEKFDPDDNITKEAMAKIIMKVYEIVVGTKSSDIALK